MSGLFAGLLLRARGFAGRHLRAGRRASSPAAAPASSRSRSVTRRCAGSGIDAARSRRRDDDAQDPRRRRPRDVCELECPQTLTAWERLYRILRDAFPAAHYHRGMGLKRFEQNGGAVVGAFQRRHDAREADLLVGADGIRSTVRQQLLPELAPLYAGYVAWRALMPEQAIPPAIHRELFEYMTFCLPPGEQFLGYPVAGPDNDLRPGHRRYNVVWYRPAEEAPSCSACSPTRAASRIRSRSRRR